MSDELQRGLEGVLVDLSTPIFAMSRVAGWVAHVDEYLEDNRLIRPRSRYVGPDRRSVVPIGERPSRK